MDERVLQDKARNGTAGADPPGQGGPGREANAELWPLIAARICHDLVSPLGAIGNGLELLELAGGAGRAEAALIAESQRACTDRVAFFRVAFGAGGDARSFSAEEAGAMLHRFALSSGAARPHWQVSDPVTRAEAQLGFLGYLCLDRCLPAGGAVTLARAAGRWRLSTEGAELRALPDLWRAARGGPAPPLSPAEVQFGLLPRCALALGREPELSEGAGGLVLTV
ncbi:histidine phosphotransferase [Roseivivax sp. GX 12232]|uniref:histidine phosphotransferase family protein n=1 Tax=Roseivivax sp. GX 12232 TaxID=2900547 RepID=UPI001E654B87|nr:histidine phosphotransferase family protein [Roseivivax sp. GX 12232]MCE0506507.1 histidine phosphotransferase [Roseivivax sp. GX 12232]